MNEGLIPKRYAKALLKLATERGDDSRIYTLMQALSASFASQPSLAAAIRNPFLGYTDKQRLLMAAAGATEKDTTFIDFLKLLDRNKRTGMAREAVMAYMDLYRKANHIYRVKVTTAAPMDPKEENRLKKLIEDRLNGGTMEYNLLIDPELIGGFTVDIDSERLDASVANELKQLRHKLLS